MYVRDGKRMFEPEEGAAYFDPKIDMSGVEFAPRPMGLQRGMLTQGFVPIPGFGADEGVSTEVNLTVPFLAAAAGAVGAFFLFRRRR